MSNKKQQQKKEYIPNIRNFINRRIRITYYNRDCLNLTGERSVGDVDHIVDGTLRFYRHEAKTPHAFNGSVSFTACVEAFNGEQMFCFLPLDGPLISTGYSGRQPGFDGRRNGSYEIVVMEEENDSED